MSSSAYSGSKGERVRGWLKGVRSSYSLKKDATGESWGTLFTSFTATKVARMDTATAV
jgi:hypothetical protein